MVRYLVSISILLLLVFVYSCSQETKSLYPKQSLETVALDAVSKSLQFREFDINNENNLVAEKTIKNWFNNKIKTNGLEGSLTLIIEDLNSLEVSEKEFFKFSIDIIFKFEITNPKLKSTRSFMVKTNEFSEISGPFTLQDRENLILYVINSSLAKTTSKIKSLI